MSRYRRQFTGSTFFFVVVAYRRRRIFCTPTFRTALRCAVETVRLTRPFAVDAWVLLPDHMHCIWTLADDDRDYSTRWAEIKRFVSSAARNSFRDPRLLTRAGKSRGESTVWQRRFWEHQIRDENDYERHFDYIHFNPVKHGYVESACEWPHSTFHRYVGEGMYPRDWGGSPDILDMELE